MPLAQILGAAEGDGPYGSHRDHNSTDGSLGGARIDRTRSAGVT
jgi:hypothetical protein